MVVHSSTNISHHLLHWLEMRKHVYCTVGGVANQALIMVKFTH